MEKNNTYIKVQFNLLNNQVTSLKRLLVSKHTTTRFVECHGDSKLIWQNINNMLVKNCRVKTLDDIVVNMDGILVSNQQEVANIFCNYFSNIVATLTDNCQTNPGNNHHLNTPETASIFLSPVNEEEIIIAINRLKSKKSPGHDLIHPKVIKECQKLVSKPLVDIINVMLTNAISLVSEIINALDQNKQARDIFVDLRKAFDLVNHEILLSKLERYSIRDTALNLLKSY
ncbi:hypothetical protein PR048_001963 [Dryococelus australis]|uniref:Reverse transcriptase domain-containing protein n=1 Tax=Dryococelus australis TaxID=614101 RepID=A0ABQ9IK81_9NEOP|nr:hypothetical protein PR048_001963 [Dryococelus australis]